MNKKEILITTKNWKKDLEEQAEHFERLERELDFLFKNNKDISKIEEEYYEYGTYYQVDQSQFDTFTAEVFYSIKATREMILHEAKYEENKNKLLKELQEFELQFSEASGYIMAIAYSIDYKIYYDLLND